MCDNLSKAFAETVTKECKFGKVWDFEMKRNVETGLLIRLVIVRFI